MTLKTLDEAEVAEKLVLLRIDVNAAVVQGKVLDEPRFAAAAQTIKELLDKKAGLVILAHQGRKGEEDFLPLKQHAKILSKYAQTDILYAEDLFGDDAKEMIDLLEPGQAVMLENVRVYDDETNVDTKDNKYKEFCKLFDLYVNDAFSVCHRAQGSIVIPPKYLPSYMGRNLQKEIEALRQFAYDEQKKTVFLIGGSKVEDYIPILNNIKGPNVKILASGVLGNLFLIARGYSLGYEAQWMQEKGFDKFIPQLAEIYNKYSSQILLPIDFATGKTGRKEVLIEKMPVTTKLWDIGKKTIELFNSEIDQAQMVFMKGPVGFSEMKPYSYGTVEILKHIAQLTKDGKTFRLLGGGHLTTAIQQYKIPNTFSYISLSGGALLKYLSGEPLPGLEALENSKK